MSSRPIRPSRASSTVADARISAIHVVQRVQRLHVPAVDVRLPLGLREQVASPPDDHVDLVVHPVPDELVQAERARHAVDQGQHVGAEGVLQLGVLEEVVEHDLGDRVPLEHDHDPQAGLARGVVAQVSDPLHPAGVDQLGDLHLEVVRVDLVRQLGDDQAGPVLDLLDLDHGPHDDRATAGPVGVLDSRGCP